MLYNSKCLAPAFLCYNIILFFSIQVTGQLPLFPPPTSNMPPPIPQLSPPPSPNLLPPPPVSNLLPPISGLLTPPSVPEICPKNKVTMKIVCANVLGIPVLPVSRGFNPLGTPCCKFIEELLDIEVAICFCRAITFNTSDPRTNIPVSLVLLLNYCQKELSHDFRCATS